MDYEKAFYNSVKQGVEQAMNECELTLGMTLKEAVEKQMPKKPNVHKISVGLVYSCSACNRTLCATWEYCSKCGQKIDWDIDWEDGE